MALCTIIGVGPNLGVELAKTFAKQGYDLALFARTKDRLDTWKEEITNNHSVAVHTAGVDICDLDFSSRLAAYANSELLIYNVARVEKTNLLETSVDQIQSDFLVGVSGAIASMQVVLPYMKRRGKGTILLTSGGFAKEPHFEYLSLGMAKAAMENLVAANSTNLADNNVHLAAVRIWGKIQRGSNQYDPQDIAKTYLRIHQQQQTVWEHFIDIK